MESWEETFVDGLDQHSTLRTELRANFDREGLRLAQWLSVELGNAFEVEYGAQNHRKLRVHGDSVGTNPRAVAAFQAIADAHRTVWRAIEDEGRQGNTFRWV
jgi:hypothetical protein